MVFHFLSRSSSPATNFMNRLRCCRSLPANRPWLIIRENAAKSHHAALSSAPNPYSYATLSRFFSTPSLKESGCFTIAERVVGSALLYKETTTGDRKGEKSDHSYKMGPNAANLYVLLPCCVLRYLIDIERGTEDRVKPVSFEDLSKLLDAGDVDHILVADSFAILYVSKSIPLPLPGIVTPPYKFMIDIESPKSFTEKLERTQEALGVPRPEYVPITYVDAMNEESKS